MTSASSVGLLTAGTLNLDGLSGGSVGAAAIPQRHAVGVIPSWRNRRGQFHQQWGGGRGYKRRDDRRRLQFDAYGRSHYCINNNALNVGAGNITLTTTGAGTLNLGQNVTGSTVAINNSGAQTGAGVVTATTALDLGGGGALALTANTPVISLNTSGGVSTVNDVAAASLSISFGFSAGNGSLTLTAGPTTVTGPLGDATESLTFNTGALSGSGLIAAQTLSLNTSGDVGAAGPGNALNTQASQINLNTGAGANVFLNQTASTPLTIGGTTSGNITLAAGNTTISPALNAGSGAVSRSTRVHQARTLTFSSGITGGTVTINYGGAVSGSGQITATSLDLTGSANVGATGAGNALNTAVSSIVLSETGGAVDFINNGSAGVDISGTISGLGNGLTLTAGATTVQTGALSAGNITLNTSTLNLSQPFTGTASVTLNNSGAITASVPVTTPTLNLTGAGGGTLTTSATTVTVNGEAGVGGTVLTDTAGVTDLAGSASGQFTLNANAITIDPSGFNAGSQPVTLNYSGPLIQLISGNGVLAAGTLTLNGTGVNSVGSSANSPLLINAQTLSLTLAGTPGASFISDSAATLNLSGDTAGAALTLTAGNTTISGSLMTGALVLNTGSLAVNNQITAPSVTLNNSGAVSSSSLNPISTSALTLSGAGGSVTSLSTSAATITFSGANAESAGSVISDTAPTVDLAGTVFGNVSLTANAINIDSAGFSAAGQTVTLVNSGALANGGAGLLTAGTLNLDGGSGSTVGSSLTPLATAVNAIQFGPAASIGASFINNGSGGVDVGGSTGGGSLTLIAGATTVNTSPLNLGVGNLNLTATTLNISQPVTAGVVTLNDSGAVTASGSDLVTATTLNLNSLGGVGSATAWQRAQHPGRGHCFGHGRQYLPQSKRRNSFGYRRHDRGRYFDTHGRAHNRQY